MNCPDCGEEMSVARAQYSDGCRSVEICSSCIVKHVQEQKEKRTNDMPTESDAIRQSFRAWYRLKELGWKEAIFCPKDGSSFLVIEPGSTGIHRCHYDGEWPDGYWWIEADGDLHPSHPILFKLIEPVNPISE